MISAKESIKILRQRHEWLVQRTLAWEALNGRPRHGARAEMAAVRRALWEMGVSEDQLPQEPALPPAPYTKSTKYTKNSLDQG